MPVKKPVAPVAVRLLEPAQQTDPEALRQMLYRPVRQLDGPPQFKVRYVWVNREKARELLRTAESDKDFRQRVSYPNDIRRWQGLFRSKRFVHFFPGGPVCFDDKGVMLNGKNRMMAIAGLSDEEADLEFGFEVKDKVPRWMFAYFDTNRNRTKKDTLHIGNRPSGPQTPTIISCAMRYEEMLLGLRRTAGWRQWRLTRDENEDVDNFYGRRLELHDWYKTGEKVQRLARLSHPAVTVFRFYQSLAWPDGDETISEYIDQLTTREDMLPSLPAIRLRYWARTVYYDKTEIIASADKRELHLMLLFRTFESHAKGGRINTIPWAFGNPMALPFHPEGWEVAVENIKKALHEMDEDFA